MPNRPLQDKKGVPYLRAPPEAEFAKGGAVVSHVSEPVIADLAAEGQVQLSQMPAPELGERRHADIRHLGARVDRQAAKVLAALRREGQDDVIIHLVDDGL